MARPPRIPRPVVDEPSKTQLKKDMHSLQELGEVLTTLSPEQLDQLDLTESLRDALEEVQRVGKHEARRRHMQYVGKLMRFVDPEPIRAQIERWEAGTRAHKAAFKLAERWRDRLIDEDAAITEFMHAEPSVDKEKLITLINAAKLQAKQGEAPAASRKIFRIVHQAMMRVSPVKPAMPAGDRTNSDDDYSDA